MAHLAAVQDKHFIKHLALSILKTSTNQLLKLETYLLGRTIDCPRSPPPLVDVRPGSSCSGTICCKSLLHRHPLCCRWRTVPLPRVLSCNARCIPRQCQLWLFHHQETGWNYTECSPQWSIRQLENGKERIILFLFNKCSFISVSDWLPDAIRCKLFKENLLEKHIL